MSTWRVVDGVTINLAVKIDVALLPLLNAPAIYAAVLDGNLLLISKEFSWQMIQFYDMQTKRLCRTAPPTDIWEMEWRTGGNFVDSVSSKVYSASWLTFMVWVLE